MVNFLVFAAYFRPRKKMMFTKLLFDKEMDDTGNLDDSAV